MQIVRHALQLNFISQVSNAQRKHIGTREDGINLEFPVIKTARPSPIGLIEVKPVILPVDAYVVEHKENQLPVASCQRPVILSQSCNASEAHGFRGLAETHKRMQHRGRAALQRRVKSPKLIRALEGA
jgi:hypothetical protein